jgi:phosphatidylglycerol:prolipoprotein diacylglycerol transferase
MLTISINPVAFTIGPFEVRWYGIMAAIGVLSILALMVREAKRLGITREVYGIFIWGVIGGLIGGRLAYVIYYWERFAANPRTILSFAGLAQNGMVLGIIGAALIYMGVTRMRFSTLLRVGDAFAVGAPVGLALGRVGCTLNGCCYGMPSPFKFFPLAVIYTPRDSMLPKYWGVPVYPTQIYHVIWNLIVFAVVWRLREKFKPEGALVFFYFCIHAIGDLGLRFLRADRGIVIWNLDIPQLIDLAALLAFLPWLIIRIRQFQNQALVAELADGGAKPEQSHED